MRSPADLTVVLATALCFAQAPATVPANATTTTTYHSDTMSFDFVYPARFVAPKEPTNEASGGKKASPSCVSVPVAVMDMRTGFNMIILKSYDGGCLGKEFTAAGLGTAAASVLTDTLGQFGQPNASSNTDYEINGHSASAVSGSVAVPNARGKSVIYERASCVISGKSIVCFQFLSNDCPALAILSASTIKFADGTPNPVIPEKLAAACKP